VRITPAIVRSMLTACAGLCLLVVVSSAFADNASDQLDQAVELFEQGQYTAAQEVLVKIDPLDLDDAHRAVRDEYVDRTRVAITMVDKAELDFERADTAIQNENFAAARTALQSVLDNEYATRAQREDAQQQLKDIASVSGNVRTVRTPARANNQATEMGTMEEVSPARATPTPTPATLAPDTTSAKRDQAQPAEVEIVEIEAPAPTPTPRPATSTRNDDGVDERYISQTIEPMETIEPARTPTPQPRSTPVPVQSSQAVQTTQPAEVVTISEPSNVTSSNTTPSRVIDDERARNLIREGYAAMESGRTAEAARLFRSALQAVPGHPDAMAGLRQAERAGSTEVGSQSLLDRIKTRNRLAWERSVFQFRELEKEIKNAVLDRQFELAQRSLLRARQVLEAGAQFADPRVKYESLKSELEALETFVGEEKRSEDEARVRQQRDEIQRKERERQRRVADTRQRRVTALMEQALQLRKDHDYKGAIDVLSQVLAIDPRNNRARWLKDDLQDVYELTRQHSATMEKRRQQQAVLVDAEESKIPWHELLKYPDNWLDITSSPDRVASGRERRTPADNQLYAKLENNIPVDIEDVAFEEVIDEFASNQGVNMTVIWNDLEAQGIDRDLPVTLRFATDVTVKKALDEILEQVGGGEVELGYIISDGVIKIASQDLLDEEVYIDVYPIEDLLISVPDFQGPTISITENGGGGSGGGGGGGSGGGGGGGGFGGGAGGGAGGGGGGGSLGGFGQQGNQNPFTGGEENDDEGDGDADREERVTELLDLIRNTIEPDSWRESGGTVAAIAEINGQLVVTQTASAHSEIQDLLGKLREQRAIQIAIEARFITITSNYLEELGIDLDIILNQGNAGFDRSGRTYNGANVLIPRSFSRMGFLPGVPGVGNQFTAPGVGLPTQPYGQVGLVPNAGGGLVNASRMTPIPVISNVIDLVQPTSTVVPNSFGGSTVPSLSLFGSFLDGIQVDFLLRATQADRRSSIMNAPRLVLFNGQRAWVGVLTSASYVAGVLPVVDENAVAQQPFVQQLQTGTVLDVQAVVSADKRYVTMNLRPGVRQPTGPLDVFPFSGGASGAAAAADAFIQLPNTQSQVIRTTVSVPDGGTLLIGGLKTTQEIETEAGVPVLSKIPVLKRLYSARNLVKDEQVLLILVKPSILIQSEQEEAAFPTFGQR
jgi:type II secretory pathway component GspD/PulD (secretin)/tetratricopeptide (TPR) repeat protein